jgi:hypothetical protein
MSTIQECIDRGERIAVHCHNPVCYRESAFLDLEALKAKLGPGHGAMHWDLVPLLRCSVCGSKNVGITIHVDQRPTGDLRSPFRG